MTVTGVTSSTISVQWGSVPCIHQNGDITGYSVQYEVMEVVGGGSTTETTLSSLTALTNYSIQVAAVTSSGTGVFSDPVIGFTNLS